MKWKIYDSSQTFINSCLSCHCTSTIYITLLSQLSNYSLKPMRYAAKFQPIFGPLSRNPGHWKESNVKLPSLSYGDVYNGMKQRTRNSLLFTRGYTVAPFTKIQGVPRQIPVDRANWKIQLSSVCPRWPCGKQGIFKVSPTYNIRSPNIKINRSLLATRLRATRKWNNESTRKSRIP